MLNNIESATTAIFLLVADKLEMFSNRTNLTSSWVILTEALDEYLPVVADSWNWSRVGAIGSSRADWESGRIPNWIISELDEIHFGRIFFQAPDKHHTD